MNAIELSIVIPIHNEEETLSELHVSLKTVLSNMDIAYEVIFVDDGSFDKSLAVLKEICQANSTFKYISFTRNFGHQNAILAGIENAKGTSIVLMDGDLQDPPEVIPDMYQKFQEGFQVVSAVRIKRENESIYKKGSAKVFYRLFRAITKTEMPYDSGDFKIISRGVAKHISAMKEKNKFLRGQISWLGFKHGIVEYQRAGRKYGETKFSNRKMMKFAWDGITSFSNFPLKIAIYLGLVFSIVSFGIVLYALYSKFILQEVVTGWTSLIISVTFIGGIQLLCLGVLGEYISRISDNLRARPDYIVEEQSFENII